MANFKQVNEAIRDEFQDKDIEVVRGDGYVYFDGDDGFDKYSSIYVHPVSISTERLIEMVIEHIKYEDVNGNDIGVYSIMNDC
ncbi:MAG: hypothetical protein K0U20_08610 [Proteobacteria bacterium]|nr:hypothetical protein [Pseudomonadota bacterium]